MKGHLGSNLLNACRSNTANQAPTEFPTARCGGHLRGEMLGFCRSSGCCVAPLFLRERPRKDNSLDDDPLYLDEKLQDNLLVEEVSERNHSNVFIMNRNMVVFCPVFAFTLQMSWFNMSIELLLI